MEIVEAQDVREVQFDPDTGKPIRDRTRTPSGAVESPSTMPPIASTSTSTSDRATERQDRRRFDAELE